MNILVLTGAGISAESGIPTFRDANGLWEGHAVEEVATPQGFASNPVLVHQFYNERRRALRSAEIQPNAAHIALAEFEQKHTARSAGDFLIVTQNIDDLHFRAGSRNVLPMHGELFKVRCLYSNKIFDWKYDLSTETLHPDDPANEELRGCLRPHVVWFGEVPIGLDRIENAASNADVFIAVGTSGLVYPAAGIVQLTKPTCRKIEVNLGDTPASDAFDECRHGKAGEILPQLLAEIE